MTDSGQTIQERESLVNKLVELASEFDSMVFHMHYEKFNKLFHPFSMQLVKLASPNMQPAEISFYIKDTEDFVVFENNEWHHVSMRWDGNKTEYFVDGKRAEPKIPQEESVKFLINDYLDKEIKAQRYQIQDYGYIPPLRYPIV